MRKQIILQALLTTALAIAPIMIPGWQRQLVRGLTLGALK